MVNPLRAVFKLLVGIAAIIAVAAMAVKTVTWGMPWEVTAILVGIVIGLTIITANESRASMRNT